MLCRPSGPRNLGTVVRVAANFAPVEVAVVSPIRRSLLLHPEFEQMSHGVEEVVSRIRVFDTLSEALADCTWSVGFSARIRNHRLTLPWSEVIPRCKAEDAGDCVVALVFGTEESGLARDETNQLMTLAHVATSDEHTSLNLGMVVGIVLYSLFEGESPEGFRNLGAPLTGQDRAYLKAHVAEALGDVARSDVARADIEASVERVLSHAEIETRDARAWHTIMRALGNKKSPVDYGLGQTARDARRDEALERARRRAPSEDAPADADRTE